jgi:putative transposase
MPEYRRLYVEGGTYFFTVNLADRRSDLLTRYVGALREAYREMTDRMAVATVAIVVLPDHLHCVWRLPQNDCDFSSRWKFLKSAFSRKLPATADAAVSRREGERGVWQRRFWEHAIRDEKDLENHIDYIHFNPVKHGQASSPDEWRYSSWHKWKAEYNVLWSKAYDANLLQVGERS